jgi:hypothetical protein
LGLSALSNLSNFISEAYSDIASWILMLCVWYMGASCPHILYAVFKATIFEFYIYIINVNKIDSTSVLLTRVQGSKAMTTPAQKAIAYVTNRNESIGIKAMGCSR